MSRHCGFVAIIGAPNAGKSTLLNRLVGTKLAIVTQKEQTTRSRTLGIVVEDDNQLIFVDTPGIFRPRRRLDRAMVRAAWREADDADVVVLLVDARRKGIPDETRDIIERLKKVGRKVMLALNKVDAVEDKARLLELADVLSAEGIFTETFMISAEKGSGVDDLKAAIAAKLPEGPWLYPEDQMTDVSQRLLAAEITREQVFLQLHQELPYSVSIVTDSWEEFEDGSVKISQGIITEREGHKAIILGKGGRTIKSIGQRARYELGKLLDRRVHLMLHVRVKENWQDDPEHYEPWGLEFKV
ncbi:MAG TPA: GTPase Era [Rhodospirillaceae bacterium]|nr:MAG: GTPase Era [Alphaproteobacteria bacterium GWF2_58_20]HAU28848.1 GTPase Era [Rhodospirillaceae bacterium]